MPHEGSIVSTAIDTRDDRNVIGTRYVAGVSPDVRLCPVEDDDPPILFEHQRDAEAARMAAFAPRDREAFLTHWTRILRDRSVEGRTIVVDGTVAGNVVCWDQDWAREVGYWIGREHSGEGRRDRRAERLPR